MKNKQYKKALVPKLRFPEFQKMGEWRYKNGDKVFKPIVNKNHKSDLPILAITQENGAIPRDMIDYKVFVSDKSVQTYKVVEIGDFIISLRSFQGGIAYSNYKGICSPAYIILRKKFDVSNCFFKQYFKTDLFIQHLNKDIEGIRDGKMVSYEQFSRILLPVPIPEEQQKIAECLSSVDELISVQTQKLEALKTHKKGLMQQLFPTDDEAIPKLRFPEFRRHSAWTNHSLAEISTRIVKKVNDLILTPVSITAGHGFVSQIEKFGRDISGQQYKNYIVLNKGEFAYNKGNSKKYPQGCIYKLKEFQQVAAPNAFICFRLKSDHIADFYQGYFDNNFHGKQLQKFITSGARSDGLLNISPDDFFQITFLAPKPKEQQKIADCLSSVDDLITAQTQKLEALKTHKKGLMQQLFPAADEGKA